MGVTPYHITTQPLLTGVRGPVVGEGRQWRVSNTLANFRGHMCWGGRGRKEGQRHLGAEGGAPAWVSGSGRLWEAEAACPETARSKPPLCPVCRHRGSRAGTRGSGRTPPPGSTARTLKMPHSGPKCPHVLSDKGGRCKGIEMDQTSFLFSGKPLPCRKTDEQLRGWEERLLKLYRLCT